MVLFNIEFSIGHLGIKRFDTELVDEKGNHISLNDQCFYLPHYFEQGSEERGTISDIPDPFAIEVGNHSEIPKGYQEKWIMNTMVIESII
ncbi:putative stress up-regulated Nod 19 [Lupinus albus]|uniref:Putative stress up-regulated Nod 19 n=1 Tax=Lupinus albus TaxID=3870 RepID=A0A6A4Q9M6_LUPAL|nr:putative stress up-regulated Nod 19 [Lupinus albus]